MPSLIRFATFSTLIAKAGGARRVAATLALAIASMAGAVYATNYSLWVNGRSNTATPGNHADFTYWGPSTTAAGVNKKSVNWDGSSRISDQNYRVRDALDCYCTGTNWCYVAAHSAGNLMVGYSLSLYGGTSRPKQNAAPNAAGQCGAATGGGTQVGWNIKWVDVAAGAGGGSELSDVGSWTTSEPLVGDLKTTTARALYDHNQTRSKMFYMYAGSQGAVYAAVLPGQDDKAVAYHSSGGISGSAGAGYCNPSDWFCNDLTLGTAAAEGGAAKWANHTVSFRDDAQAFDHYAAGNWQGVISKVRADMAAYAY